MLTKAIVFASLFSLWCFIFSGFAQEKLPPFSLEDIEAVVKDLPSVRLATLIRERGINFEVTEEVKERLRKAGADTGVMQAVEKGAAEYLKRRVEEEKKRVEADRQKLEEERRRFEEEKRKGEEEKRKLEEEKRRIEEARRRAEEEARQKAEQEAKRKAAEPAKVITGEDGAEMVLVAAGEFWMGNEDGWADEKPYRRVYLDAFHIDKFEVTNAIYKRFIEATGRTILPSSITGERYPVGGVSWADADAYCRWAGKRLPTEAEWEKAARGTDARTYPWGNTWARTYTNVWTPFVAGPVPVGSYPADVSPYGVHDLGGNVMEWVADWYDEDYYQRSPERNPKGPDSGQYRVARGGPWSYIVFSLRSSRRYRYDPTTKNESLGFRCAR